MNKETKGTVVSVRRQWWLKVNTKPVRLHMMDGATFPHIMKVTYTVGGKQYAKRKWIHAGCTVPLIGSAVTVVYSKSKPSRAKIIYNGEGRLI